MSGRKDRIPYLLKGMNWGGDIKGKATSYRLLWKRLKSKLVRRAARAEAKEE